MLVLLVQSSNMFSSIGPKNLELFIFLFEWVILDKYYEEVSWNLVPIICYSRELHLELILLEL